MNTADTAELVSIPKAAKLLGVSRKTAWNYVHRGWLPLHQSLTTLHAVAQLRALLNGSPDNVTPIKLGYVAYPERPNSIVPPYRGR